MANVLIGVAIGAVVGIVISLILKFTLFRGSTMKIVGTFLIILSAIVGGVIGYSVYLTNTASATTLTPQDQIDTITDTIEEGWQNTNGGFTWDQIQTAQDDEEAPAYDDQIINMSCYNFGDYIVFSYEDESGSYYNALFYETSNGLILDGIINDIGHTSSAGFIVGAYIPSTFYWELSGNRRIPNEDFRFNSEPQYYKSSTLGVWYDDLVSVSRQSAKFDSGINSIHPYFLTNTQAAEDNAMNEAAIRTATNATSYFISFGDVELIGTASTGYVKINSFYNYLYQQIKSSAYNTTKLIDATSCLCVPIPTELQANYPISTEKQADYDGAQYYGVYNCDIAVSLTYVKGSSSVSGTTANKNYYNTLKDDDNYSSYVEVEDVTSNNSYSQVSLKFTESVSSTYSGVDLSETPVTITFTCSNLNITKSVTISSFSELNSGVTCLLNTGETWTYLISSDALIFDNYRGSFSISSQKSTINFSYYYLENYTVVSVGLNPVTTIDTSEIDLGTYPVRIILSNSDHTYQFVFDSSTLLESYVTMQVELGTYDYSILSDYLQFTSVSGSVTITNSNRTLLFNYVLPEDEDLTFTITIATTSSYSAGHIYLSATSSVVNLIQSYLTSSTTYYVNCYVYDSEGKLVETLTHSHSGTGTCSCTWTPTYMVSGTEYTLQLRFQDYSDTTKTYLSAITTFTYNSANAYMLTYYATANS